MEFSEEGESEVKNEEKRYYLRKRNTQRTVGEGIVHIKKGEKEYTIPKGSVETGKEE